MHDVTPSTAQESVTPQVDMKLAGTRVHLTLTVPMAPVPPGAILPVLQTLSEAVGANGAGELETQGKRISCRAGCGATPSSIFFRQNRGFWQIFAQRR